MKASDVFPGKALKAADLDGHEPIVTIEKVTMQKFDDGTSKPFIAFRGKEKGLVCNKTNFNSIVEITGEDDTDNWAGKQIKLIVTKVDYQGSRVPAIRVEPVSSSRRQSVRDERPRRDDMTDRAVEPPGDDEIPF